MGSSTVTMWTSLLRLMWSTMPDRVVVLPEPVGPVTSTRPRGSIARLASTAGSPSSCSGVAPTLTWRNTRPAEPRLRKALTRNRPTPVREYAKSASFVRRNSSTRSSRSTSETIDAVSAAVRSAACSRRSFPSMRTRGGEPTLQWRSDPPQSTSARRNGSIDGVTDGASTGALRSLTLAEGADPGHRPCRLVRRGVRGRRGRRPAAPSPTAPGARASTPRPRRRRAAGPRTG